MLYVSKYEYDVIKLRLSSLLLMQPFKGEYKYVLRRSSSVQIQIAAFVLVRVWIIGAIIGAGPRLCRSK